MTLAIGFRGTACVFRAPARRATGLPRARVAGLALAVPQAPTTRQHTSTPEGSRTSPAAERQRRPTWPSSDITCWGQNFRPRPGPNGMCDALKPAAETHRRLDTRFPLAAQPSLEGAWGGGEGDVAGPLALPSSTPQLEHLSGVPGVPLERCPPPHPVRCEEGANCLLLERHFSDRTDPPTVPS